MKSSPDDPANTRSNGPNLVSGTLKVAEVARKRTVSTTSANSRQPRGQLPEEITRVRARLAAKQAVSPEPSLQTALGGRGQPVARAFTVLPPSERRSGMG